MPTAPLPRATGRLTVVVVVVASHARDRLRAQYNTVKFKKSIGVAAFDQVLEDEKRRKEEKADEERKKREEKLKPMCVFVLSGRALSARLGEEVLIRRGNGATLSLKVFFVVASSSASRASSGSAGTAGFAFVAAGLAGGAGFPASAAGFTSAATASPPGSDHTRTQHTRSMARTPPRNKRGKNRKLIKRGYHRLRRRLRDFITPSGPALRVRFPSHSPQLHPAGGPE